MGGAAVLYPSVFKKRPFLLSTSLKFAEILAIGCDVGMLGLKFYPEERGELSNPGFVFKKRRWERRSCLLGVFFFFLRVRFYSSAFLFEKILVVWNLV